MHSEVDLLGVLQHRPRLLEFGKFPKQLLEFGTPRFFQHRGHKLIPILTSNMGLRPLQPQSGRTCEIHHGCVNPHCLIDRPNPETSLTTNFPSRWIFPVKRWAFHSRSTQTTILHPATAACFQRIGQRNLRERCAKRTIGRGRRWEECPPNARHLRRARGTARPPSSRKKAPSSCPLRPPHPHRAPSS